MIIINFISYIQADANAIDEQAIWAGDLKEASRLGKKSLKVFVSSTFTDSKTERNYLMREVYPRLRDFCNRQGIDFSVFDFRWGIRDHDTDNHTTTEICMNQIERCYAESIDAPCFVFLSYNRYGWTPLPRTIPQDDFERIAESIPSTTDKDFVKKYYVLDRNATPPLFTLLPISVEIPEINAETGRLKGDEMIIS